MKVLIVEDDATTVEFVSIAFDVGWPGSQTVSTHQGGAAADLVESESPDVVILDLGLPDIDGFEVLKQIRLFSTVPIIITTVRDSEADIVKGLEWGADEYVVKPFGQLELLARVRAALRSRQYSYSASDAVICGPLRLNRVSDQLQCGAQHLHLTRTEGLVLGLLMSNAGQVVTFTELAETVWGDVYPHSAQTLRVYVRRLRQKLGSILEHSIAIHSTPSVGYLLEIPG